MNITFKKKLAVAACTGLLALGTFSCQKELLEPIPETLLSDVVAFDTPNRILAQVNGLYSFVKAGAFYGGRFIVYGDIRGEDFINETGNNVTGAGVYFNTVTDNSQNDVINLWSAAYQAINQCNVFLAGMDANEAKFAAPPFPATFAATTANQHRAEARFLRALSYYSLLQYYARPFTENNGSSPGLPLRLTPQTTLAGNDLARSTVAEVYAQVLEDLNFAEQNLPLSYPASPLARNVTRAHRNTAIALKTRVYLSMARYANVITEANKIVSPAPRFTATSGVPHALSDSIAAVFAPPQETTESILSFPFTAQNQPGTQNQLAFYFLPGGPGNGGNGEYSLNTEIGILANPAFGARDARRRLFIRTVGGRRFLTKYSTGGTFTDKAPVIRYAEVLLNLSEALARTNTDLPRSVALLNAVRGRSNGSLYPTNIAQQDLINAIMTERRIEFLGEGLRIFDIMRLNQPIPAKQGVGALQPNAPLYIWPIPATERQTNSLI